MLVKKFNIFGSDTLYEDSFFLDLKKINYEEFNEEEKRNFYQYFLFPKFSMFYL